MKRTLSDEDIIKELWDGIATRKIARQFAEIAADALLDKRGAVRQPRSATIASDILRGAARNTSAARLVKRIQRLSLRVAHSRYLAQQVAAPIPISALVESVVAAMNQSLAVWEMSPIATAVDRQLMARFKRLFGCPEEAEGTLVPGGAFGNLTALLAAREALKSRRARTARVAVIVGAQAHYSVARAAMILGMGSDAVFRVPVDHEYRTDVARVPDAFAKARSAGFRRFVLVGSAGSTPTGSVDEIDSLRREATRQGAWFHVDGAHGAALVFSRRLRGRVKSIGSADSMAFDPHKMMFMPLSGAGVLVRDGSLLARPLTERAPYLFGGERRWPDIGQLTIACSQRFDALKIWLVWQLYGARVWDALVTHTCAVCAAAFRYCAESRILEPLHEPHSNILCFRLRRQSGKHSDRIHWEVKEQLNESGYGYISSTVLDGRRVLRMVVMNPRTRAADVEDVLRRIERIAGARTT